MNEKAVRVALSEREYIYYTLTENTPLAQGFREAVQLGFNLVKETMENGGKIITIGNGGSMADAIHFTQELVGKFKVKRPPLAAICPNDAAYLSCVANDYGYDEVFSRYVEGLGKKGDTLIALSTSGYSKNVITASATARKLDMNVVSITGPSLSPLWTQSTLVISIPDPTVHIIQEVTMSILHDYCMWLDMEYKVEEG